MHYSNWQAILEPIIPTTATPAVELPITTTGSGFYRVVHVPRSLVFTAPLTVQQWGSNQLRISWPLNFPNYTLQFSVGLTGIWQNANLPVTIEGSEYVVYDTLGTVPKFYRLIP